MKALQKLVIDPKMDWNEVLRQEQSGFDSTLTALKIPNYPEANRALSKIHADDREQLQKALEPENLKRALSSEASPQEKAACFCVLMADKGLLDDFSILYPSTHMQARYRLTQLALALSAYHAEKHAYPKQLLELSPKYLPEVSNDPFSEREFHYQANENGYLLYSVGRNGIDDEGRNFNNEYETYEEMQKAPKEDQTRDDIAIRMPPKK